MKKTLFDYISNDGSSVVFGLPYTEELIGREAQLPNGERVSFGNEPAIKCDDELFLVDMEERILLVEEMEDLSLKGPGRLGDRHQLCFRICADCAFRRRQIESETVAGTGNPGIIRRGQKGVNSC